MVSGCRIGLLTNVLLEINIFFSDFIVAQVFALHLAAATGDMDRLQNLLIHGAVNEQDGDGSTPLHIGDC